MTTMMMLMGMADHSEDSEEVDAGTMTSSKLTITMIILAVLVAAEEVEVLVLDVAVFVSVVRRT